MLDLGVYVFKHAKEIAELLGTNMLAYLNDEKTVFRVKRTKDEGTDFEVYIAMEANGVKYELDTNMNPGCIQKEEVIIELHNGDKITQNWYVHPDSSNGVFIEKADGSTEEFPESVSNVTSYEE